MPRKLTIETAAIFQPLLTPARYKAAYGGRGSGKSHFFAELGVEDALRAPGEIGEGLRVVCVREIQKSLKESAKRLLESKISSLRLTEADGFKVYTDRIATPGDGTIIFQGMQDHTAESIKSLEGFHRAWVEEAQSLSARSLELLRPTIRASKSELWFSWNPRRRVDPVDAMFRGGEPPTDSVVIQANWSHNPWFPAELEQERRDCLNQNADQYPHIWEGDYISVSKGAYFARDLALARNQGRIGKVAADPLMQLRAYWDIGGSGRNADATAIWIVQFVGREIRIIDYYEAVGQPLAAHVNWLREKGYGKARQILPHDGRNAEKVYDVTYQSALEQAGFDVDAIENQGKGAAMLRVEAARRIFASCWFNEATTQAGRDALGWYHEKVDEARNVGLGPDHDWSSHAADAFGLMAIDYAPPKPKIKDAYADAYSRRSSGSWMTA